MKKTEGIAGIIPAAGYAKRISPIPCSKEIYPIGFEINEKKGSPGPKVVSSSLLIHFKDAGLKDVYFIIRKGKWDIPQYFGSGTDYKLNIAYLVTDPTPGTPNTVQLSFPFVRNKKILFGFPDIIINTINPFGKLLNRLDEAGTDIVLGLFEADNPQKVDMVETDEEGRVKNIVIKPGKTNLTHTWLLAVWTPAFTDFFHNSMLKYSTDQIKTGIKQNAHQKKELFIGDIIQRAIDSGIKVDSVRFPDSSFIDIGSPEDLKKAISSNI